MDALELYNEYDARQKYCVMVVTLSDMGFSYLDIRNVLIEKGLDLTLASETLISKLSK